VGGEAPVTPVLSLDSSHLNPSYKPCDNRYNKSYVTIEIYKLKRYKPSIWKIAYNEQDEFR
jgi:hypothetical protein